MASEGSRIFAPGLLEGRVCVVSGAGTGLGRESALELARLGATVIGCGRRQRAARRAWSQRPEPLPGSAEAVAMDIRDEQAVESLFDGVLERHGRVDVLVNNAGGQFLSPAEAISPKGFRTVIELNVVGTWLMTHAAATKAFIPQERRQGPQRHPLAPQRDAGDGPLGRRPGRGREHDAHALGRVGAVRDPHLRDRRRPVRHRDAAHQVPEGGGRGGAADRAAAAGSGPRRRWPG